MTAKQLKTARHQLELSQSALAAKLKVSTNAVSRWEQGTRPVPGIAEVALRYVTLTTRWPSVAAKLEVPGGR